MTHSRGRIFDSSEKDSVYFRYLSVAYKPSKPKGLPMTASSNNSTEDPGLIFLFSLGVIKDVLQAINKRMQTLHAASTGEWLSESFSLRPCSMHDGVCASSCAGRADLLPQPMFRLPAIDLAWPTLLAAATANPTCSTDTADTTESAMTTGFQLGLAIPACLIHDLSRFGGQADQ